jgi:hypothetical protein
MANILQQAFSYSVTSCLTNAYNITRSTETIINTGKNVKKKGIQLSECTSFRFECHICPWKCDHQMAASLTVGSNNKVRELIMVKVLHPSLLNITVVAFKVLPLGNYALMRALSPPFKTILELVLWNCLQSSWCHQCYQNAFLSILGSRSD